MNFTARKMTRVGKVASTYLITIGMYLVVEHGIRGKSIFAFAVHPGNTTWLWWPMSIFAVTRCRCSYWVEHLTLLKLGMTCGLVIANAYLWGAIVAGMMRLCENIYRSQFTRSTQQPPA